MDPSSTGMSTLRIISGPAAGTALLVEEEIVIGREGADVIIEDGELSRRHAAVRPAEGGVVVEDLGSMNGTFVNGRRISEPLTLNEAATIKVGRSELSLEPPPPAPAGAAPIAEVEQATRASDVPVVAADDATRARDIPVADSREPTRASDVPVADVPQPTRIRSSKPTGSPGPEGGPLGKLGDVPPIVFGLVAGLLVVVILILLLG